MYKRKACEFSRFVWLLADIRLCLTYLAALRDYHHGRTSAMSLPSSPAPGRSAEPQQRDKLRWIATDLESPVARVFPISVYGTPVRRLSHTRTEKRSTSWAAGLSFLGALPEDSGVETAIRSLDSEPNPASVQPRREASTPISEDTGGARAKPSGSAAADRIRSPPLYEFSLVEDLATGSSIYKHRYSEKAEVRHRCSTHHCYTVHAPAQPFYA
jgi:hypothetical protein